MLTRHTPESLKAELEHCRETAQTYFDIDLNLNRLDAQLADIIAEKVRAYYHERFQNWSVHDLHLFRRTIEKELNRQRKERAEAKAAAKAAMKASESDAPHAGCTDVTDAPQDGTYQHE